MKYFSRFLLSTGHRPLEIVMQACNKSHNLLLLACQIALIVSWCKSGKEEYVYFWRRLVYGMFCTRCLLLFRILWAHWQVLYMQSFDCYLTLSRRSRQASRMSYMLRFYEGTGSVLCCKWWSKGGMRCCPLLIIEVEWWIRSILMCQYLNSAIRLVFFIKLLKVFLNYMLVQQARWLYQYEWLN